MVVRGGWVVDPPVQTFSEKRAEPDPVNSGTENRVLTFPTVVTDLSPFTQNGQNDLPLPARWSDSEYPEPQTIPVHSPSLKVL